MKYIITFVLAVFFVFASAATVYASEVIILVDGVQVEFGNEPPVIINGRTLVPARAVFEMLGFDVEWYSPTRSGILTRHDFEIIITLDSFTFTTNGVPYVLDVPAQTINNRTMLPIRLPVESIGYTVEWEQDGSTIIAYISTGRQNSHPMLEGATLVTGGSVSDFGLDAGGYEYVYVYDFPRGDTGLMLLDRLLTEHGFSHQYTRREPAAVNVYFYHPMRGVSLSYIYWRGYNAMYVFMGPGNILAQWRTNTR